MISTPYMSYENFFLYKYYVLTNLKKLLFYTKTWVSENTRINFLEIKSKLSKHLDL